MMGVVFYQLEKGIFRRQQEEEDHCFFCLCAELPRNPLVSQAVRIVAE